MTTNALKPVHVFIASPGDVPDSRSSVRHAVERINRLVAEDSGLLLKPIGWEDISPGKASRAQEIINPHVNAASIFIGILHQRFGSPTGEAESGTEEEYNLIEHRWRTEEHKPEVLMFFKTLPPEKLTAPGEQLQKVLAFKKRIESTCLYKEFDSESRLHELVQDALCDWINKNRDTFQIPRDTTGIATLQPKDKQVLAYILEQGPLPVDKTISYLGKSTPPTEEAIQRLKNLGLLVEEPPGTLRLNNSMDGFLAIVRHMNTDNYSKALLPSRYFQGMLGSFLESIILSRFHCKVDAGMVECLRDVALLSSRATSNLLFGDTSLYDNMFENIRDKDDEAKDIVNGLMLNRIICGVLLEYGEDYINGSIMLELKSKRLAGQILSIDLKVAYEEAKAFQIGAGMPMIGAFAGSDLRKGEMCYVNPVFRIREGTICMHLDWDERAEQLFDQALSQSIPDDAKAIAFNNKGMLCLKHNRLPDAILLFEQAIALDPSRDEPRKNLEVTRTRLSEQQRDKNT